MLEKLKNAVAQAQKVGRVLEFDPSVFDDPIATKVHWTRMGRTNTNFKVRKLTESSPGRLEYKSTLSSMLFSFIFIVIGAIVPIWYFTSYHEASADMQSILLPLLFGGIFLSVGIYLFYNKWKPIVIDKTAGYFWTGKNDPSEGQENKNAVQISDIHAVQLLSEFVRGDKKSYYVYETNFVLKDAERVNIVSQGGTRRSSVAEAELLAKYLDIPFWDAS